MANMGAKPIVVGVSGGILIYSGIKGITVSAMLRSLLTGGNPSDLAPTSNPGGSGVNYSGSSTNEKHDPGHPGSYTGGTHLSIGQIYQLATGAGFSPTQAVVATAVAMAESGARPLAHCLNCVPGVKEDSRGLWQINVLAHPQYANTNLYDPAQNAAAAYAVSSSGRNFGPWSTYTNGAYRGFLSAAMKAAGGH